MIKDVKKRKCHTPVVAGDTFGKLTVLSYVPADKTIKHGYCVCECSCGTVKNIRKSSLVDGYTKSCGCEAKRLAGERLRTHGLSKHPMYPVWEGMHRRCFNSERKDYKHYGGRGITVREEWMGDDGLVQFIEDMYPSFSEGLEIERIDVNGDYCKDNCCWVSRREQVINRRPTGACFDTHYLTFNGETLCMSEWADRLSIPPTMISDRITKLGWPVEKALTEPAKIRESLVVIQGVEYRPKDIFVSHPNVYSVSAKLGIKAHEYLSILFSGIGTINILLCKEWLEFKTPEHLKGFNIYERKVPRIREDFIFKSLVPTNV